MEPLTPIWQKSAEFGLTAFLLVLVLIGSGIALWKIGNRIVDVVTDSMRRQSEAYEKTADAVSRIGDLASAIHSQSERTLDSLQVQLVQLTGLNREVQVNRRVMKTLLAAVFELTPEQSSRVRGYLEDARRHLETD